ncbi:stromal interaction molecule 1-like [Saccoglossus kowalevskii]
MFGLSHYLHPTNWTGLFPVVVIIVATSWIISAGQHVPEQPHPLTKSRKQTTALTVPVAETCEDTYESCHIEEKDLLGWAAIKALHRQLDDDANGSVDLSESDEFLRDELQYEDDFDRQTTFHGDDNFISVDDLWLAWKNSEVYNWTVEDTIVWLVNSVDLPQYTDTFQNNAVDGPMLPRIAVNNGHFLSTILGIKDSVNKHKIILKAMDVVLFGAPKLKHNYVKDTILVLSLLIAVGGCWFAYVQHKFSQRHMKQMMKDMESLQTAEQSLCELQEKLQLAHQQKKTVIEEKHSLEAKMKDEILAVKAEAEKLSEAKDDTDGELSRLRLAEQELQQVRCALRKAEMELESRSQWLAPPILQQWLQLTHEVELQYYNEKKTSAERQLAAAKEGCEKLRKKRNAFMGSFRIAHGSSLDEVDHRILSAKNALSEVTANLQEKLYRWSQIESLMGVPIVSNAGLAVLSQALHSDSSTTPGAQSPISTSSSQSTASMTPMDMNPNMGVDDYDEDVPPTYSMVTGIGTAPMPRTSPLRTVQSASCLPSMAVTSTTVTYPRRQMSDPVKTNIRNASWFKKHGPALDDFNEADDSSDSLENEEKKKKKKKISLLKSSIKTKSL